MNKASGELASGPTAAGHSASETQAHGHRAPRGKALILLAFGALGVVYGDIGTSPLYALRECFHGEHGIDVSRTNVLGVLSLVFWVLTLIISVKYIALVLRADNKGEGGVLALLSLALPEKRGEPSRGLRAFFIGLGVFGSALLYGDGIITPAVSIMSAVEGLNVATPKFEPYVIPITIAIIVGLFAVQRSGTGSVGNIFGPVTLIWFIAIAALGVRAILRDPGVFAAINPAYAVTFLLHSGKMGFVVLGAVVLVITGGEALYADMGHFGRTPIRLAWYTLVLPSLLLNYFGQGALLLSNPAAKENPFYNLCPGWTLYPMVVIATTAAIIASQALISGAFSLTMQAIHLGYSPRMKIDHTSSETRGQIYMPQLNWALMLACIGLVLGFQSSSALAAAYGVAVTFTMFFTTMLFFFAARRLWKWSWWQAGLICGLFLVIEGVLCIANLLKIAHGGWFPLVVALFIYTLMSTWKTGRRILGERLRGSMIPLNLFLDDVEQSAPHRVPGTAIFMSSNAEATPLALLHNLKHNRVLHKQVIFLTIVVADVPHVDPAERVEIENLRPLRNADSPSPSNHGALPSPAATPGSAGVSPVPSQASGPTTDSTIQRSNVSTSQGFFRVIAHYGFMEDPNVPDVLERARAKGLHLDWMNTTFFLSRETIIPTKMPGMAIWRERLFAFLSRNAQRPTDFFRIPANRVVELGMQVEM